MCGPGPRPQVPGVLRLECTSEVGERFLGTVSTGETVCKGEDINPHLVPLSVLRRDGTFLIKWIRYFSILMYIYVCFIIHR